MADAFIEGLQEGQEIETKAITIYDPKTEVNHCIGCFNCWTKTPGKCVFKDSMVEVLEAVKEADVIIWAFPLYYFGLPSKAKACMDRFLPLNQPYMTKGRAGHVQRYDLSHQKNVVISSGGLSTVENNFEALEEQFNLVGGNHGGGYTKLFLAQSPLLEVPQLKETTNKYMELVRQAGREFAQGFTVSQETQSQLQKPMYPVEVYNEFADSSWIVADENGKENEHSLLPFTRQMAALYNKNSHTKDVVIEMEYTDCNEVYQILLQKERATVITEDFVDYTIKIETPYSVWQDISEGKLSGVAALMAGKYKVLGDMQVMMHWGDYFGAGEEEKHKAVAAKPQQSEKTNMNMMLIPWIVMWVALPFSNVYGGIATIAATLLLPVVFYKTKFTVYDKLSALITAIIAMLCITGVAYTTVQPISYLLFSLLWLGSMLTGKPLSSHYSNVSFGGEEAFTNPIFMKTNAILTLCWGVLYVGIAAFTFAVVKGPIQPYLVIINNIPPILLGIFTKWFQNWYPQQLMRGNKYINKKERFLIAPFLLLSCQCVCVLLVLKVFAPLFSKSGIALFLCP